MKLLIRFMNEEGGQAISEYGGMLSMLAVMIAALFFFGLPALTYAFEALSNGLCHGMNAMAAGATQGYYM